METRRKAGTAVEVVIVRNFNGHDQLWGGDGEIQGEGNLIIEVMRHGNKRFILQYEYNVQPVQSCSSRTSNSLMLSYCFPPRHCTGEMMSWYSVVICRTTWSLKDDQGGYSWVSGTSVDVQLPWLSIRARHIGHDLCAFNHGTIQPPWNQCLHGSTVTWASKWTCCLSRM